MPTFKKVVFSAGTIAFHLSDKRAIVIPLAWCEKLMNSTKDERENYVIRGHFVFWYSIDESIEVEHLLNGLIVPKRIKKTVKSSKNNRDAICV